MEKSLGLGKKSYGTETDTETWSWFRLPIPKPGFGCTLVRPLHSFNKYRKFLLSSLETFFCRNLENFGMYFWANVMLSQSLYQASRASPAQKPQVLRVVCSKNFSMATFFVFVVTYLVDSFLSYLPVKRIWRNRAVCTSSTEIETLNAWISTNHSKYQLQRPAQSSKQRTKVQQWTWVSNTANASANTVNESSNRANDENSNTANVPYS
jgi:hypothetical protein